MVVDNVRSNTLTAWTSASGAFSRIAAVIAVPWPSRSTKSGCSPPRSSMATPPAIRPAMCGC
jgi:hypothetical protein